jgi:type II secretory pathway component PulK
MRTQQGTALILALVLVATIAVFATVFTSSLSALRRAERQQRLRAECEQIARAGIERAIWELARSPAFQEAMGQVNRGTYQVAVQSVPDQPGQRDAVSTGSVPGDVATPLSVVLRARLRVAESVDIAEWLER